MRTLVAFGMGTKIIRDVAIFHGQNKIFELNRSFYSLLLLRLIVAIGVFLFSFLISIQLHNIILLYAVCAVFFATLFDFILATFQGLQKFRNIIVTLLSQSIVYIVGIFIIVHLYPQVSYVYFTFILSFTFSLIYSVALLKKSLVISIPRLEHFSVLYIKESLNFIANLYLLSIMLYAYTSFGTILLGSKGAFKDTAVFTVPFNLILIPASLFGMGVISVYFPRISQLHRDNNLAVNFFEHFSKGLLWITITIAITFVVIPEFIINTLFTSKYQESAKLLTILSPLLFLQIFQNILIFTFAAFDKPIDGLVGLTIQTAALASLSTLIVFGNLEYGLVLLSLAYVISIVLGLGIQLSRLKNIMDISIKRMKIIELIFIALLLSVPIRLLSPPNLSTVGSILVGIMALLSYILLTTLTRVIDDNDRQLITRSLRQIINANKEG
jgi:O-antigen/teichoic acid export membrane protein